MSLKAIFYAYIIGGFTFIPLVIATAVLYTIYTSLPVQPKPSSHSDEKLRLDGNDVNDVPGERVVLETNDAPRTRKGWLNVRRTFEEQPNDSGYVNFMRTFLDARTKDPKRSRPRDMWYVVLKGRVLYLYEDEGLTECEAAIELSGYDVIISPEGLLDGELFARRNAICLKPKLPPSDMYLPSITREMKFEKEDLEAKIEQSGISLRKKEKAKEKLSDMERKRDAAQDEAFNVAAPWFMFLRSNTEMEDWYLALIHASEHPAQTPTLEPLRAVFEPTDMDYLVTTLDEQPDVIPMRWFNALIGRIFFSYYRTHILEALIIGKLMKKLSKVKRPTFLSDIVVTEVSVGDKAPTFSKPMLKELTKEGDASMEVHARYKGEVRITVEATATINLGARLKTYTVKLVLAAILREIEGNMLIKVKRPPSNRIWYAFTQMPRIVLDVEPVVSDRQITWSMILSTIEARLKEIIQESVVLPNMDDIAFFESSTYSRRGGIWVDACRKKRATVSIIQPTNQTLPSAPEVELQDVLLSLPQNDAVPALGRAATEPLDQYVFETPIPDDVQNTEVHTAEGPSDTATTTPGTRRRSWFTGARTEESSTAAGQLQVTGEKQVDEEVVRGRKFESTKAVPISARSSSSRDGMIEVNPGDTHQDIEDSTSSQQFLSPHESRRSSSRRSLRDTHRRNDSAESTKSILERSTLTPPRRVSDATSTTSSSSSPPGAGSFFSTLRSKDRQAIKDSAKEAMRKLGVNWGLKNVIPSNKDPVMDSAQVAKEGTGSMIRTSYADVTAAVAERRERKKMNTTDVTGTGASENEQLDMPNAFVDDKGKDLVVSSLPIPPLRSPENRERRSLSRGHTDIDDPPVEGHHPTPILVQPQGKTMTIPGIHASHRGEIMAMGYVAPAMVQTDSKYKNNPAINSFYRLLKSPVLADQESSQVPLDDNSGASDNTNEDVTPLTLGLSSPNTEPPTRIPPPLPPRSIPVTVSNPTSNASTTSTTGGATSASQALRSIVTKDNDTRLRRHTEGLEPSESDSIEENSMETRINEVQVLIPPAASPPPLPPRRIQTSP